MRINHFSQIGKRSNNEDSLGFTQGLLTVCDGIGGHVSGERASAFVKDAMIKAFDKPNPIGKMEIQQQLNQVQADLNLLLDKEPELEKMGTTFTGVFITPDVWYAAHIGDSRIYLFRPSEQKLWHTWDHSLVGELMRTHEITIEAGRFHPMSNRIGKAILAQKDGKPASASIVKIDELKAGDIFMLCSDGVIEAWGDLELVKLFSDSSISFDEKCKCLQKQCNERSKDNNTALIAEIEASDAISFGGNEELDWTTFAQVEADYNQFLKDTGEAQQEPKPEEKPQQRPQKVEKPMREEPACLYGPPSIIKPRKRWSLIAVIAVVIAAVILALCLLLKPKSEEPPQPAKDSKEKQEVPAPKQQQRHQQLPQPNQQPNQQSQPQRQQEKPQPTERHNNSNNTI